MATTTCNLFVSGVPMPAPRPRARSFGKVATIYHPSEYTKWKAAWAAQIRDALPGGLPSTENVRVEIVVQVERPRTSKLTHPGPDVDNYAKGILDAVTESGVVWDDDKRVVHLTISKRWSPSEEEPGAYITITPEDQ